MDISINITNLVFDIAGQHLMETKSTDGVPRGVAVQALKEANGRLQTICGRFLHMEFEETAEDSLAEPENFYYSFCMTSRRASGKAFALAQLIHSYLVNSALAKIYSSTALPDLASIHDNRSVADATSIRELLNTKLPPIA